MKMQSLNITKHNRKTLAVIILVTMIFIGVLSAFFTAHEAGHKCHTDECPICSFIHHCDNTIKELGTGVAVSVLFIIPLLFIGTSLISDSENIIRETPISKKIRLND